MLKYDTLLFRHKSEKEYDFVMGQPKNELALLRNAEAKHILFNHTQKHRFDI